MTSFPTTTTASIPPPALDTGPLLQVEYSPFTLDIEDEKIGLLKAARELGVAIVAYSPLGRGFLTGRFVSTCAPPLLPWDGVLTMWSLAWLLIRSGATTICQRTTSGGWSRATRARTSRTS